jgi:hypothetical protein
MCEPGNGIHANTFRRIFDGERLRGRVDSALGENGEHRRHAGNCVIGHARRDADDVSGAVPWLQTLVSSTLAGVGETHSPGK